MPQPYWREHMRYSHRYTLRQAAKENNLIIVRCSACRRVVNYLAADLAQILEPSLDARFPHFPCGKCRTEEYLHITIRPPEPGDYGSLTVRRPAGLLTRRLWKDLKLGDAL